jgi:hypothetical protein
LCNDVLSFTRQSFLLSSVALGATAVLKMPAPAVAQGNTAICPFSVNINETEIVELRRRIAATRWPDRETVSDTSQGVPLDMIRGLAEYWSGQYDWRKFEARLNAFPQYMTEIDGVDIHFIHVRSKHDNAMPLIMTHGWPGSLVEFIRVIEPLTDPTAYGASANVPSDIARALQCGDAPPSGLAADERVHTSN